MPKIQSSSVLHQAQNARLWWQERPCMSMPWHKRCPKRHNRTLYNRALFTWVRTTVSCQLHMLACVCRASEMQCKTQTTCTCEACPMSRIPLCENTYTCNTAKHSCLSHCSPVHSSVLDSCAWRHSTSRLTLTGPHADVAEAISALQKLPVRPGFQADHECGHLSCFHAKCELEGQLESGGIAP